jgi:hypothetical protein
VYELKLYETVSKEQLIILTLPASDPIWVEFPGTFANLQFLNSVYDDRKGAFA